MMKWNTFFGSFVCDGDVPLFGFISMPVYIELLLLLLFSSGPDLGELIKDILSLSSLF